MQKFWNMPGFFFFFKMYLLFERECACVVAGEGQREEERGSQADPLLRVGPIVGSVS